MKILSYKNCTKIKLKNKRINILVKEDTSVIIEFIILSPDKNPRAVHKVFKNKAISTSFMISNESYEALLIALQDRFLKNKSTPS